MFNFKYEIKIYKKFFIKKFSDKIKSPLIETSELRGIINNNNVKIIDTSLYEKIDEKEVLLKSKFENERIPNSIYISLKEFSDVKNEVPFKMPSDKDFSNTMLKYNIKKEDKVVCYDRHGIYTSARLWYTLKISGMKEVYVLNGGYNDWKNENLPIDTSPPIITQNKDNKESINFKIDREYISDYNNIIYVLMNKMSHMTNEDIIDSRNHERHIGQDDEPVPTKNKGSLQYSANVFYKDLLDENSRLKSKEELLEIFNKVSVDINSPLTVFSGVGISACVVILALNALGKFDNIKLFDGGWQEYGNQHVHENPELKKFDHFKDNYYYDMDRIINKLPFEEKQKIEKIKRSRKESYRREK